MSSTLSFEMNKTAEWRAKKAERHPEDSRNHIAVVLLNQLAAQDANDDLSARYDALHEDENIDTEVLSQVHSDVLGDIGFRWEPKHVDEVLDRIIAQATASAGS